MAEEGNDGQEKTEEPSQRKLEKGNFFVKNLIFNGYQVFGLRYLSCFQQK